MTSRQPASDPDRDGPVHRALPAHFREKTPLTDTAGTPWASRESTGAHPFAGDRGQADPALAAALDAVAAGAPDALERVVAALASARILVPILAVATGEAETAHGLQADNASDMAMVAITGADGTTALPVFPSVDALTAWNAQARPVPMPTAQAAASAVAEGLTALIVHPGTDQQILIGRAPLWALGQGLTWTPAWSDPRVQSLLDAHAGAEPALDRIEVEPGRRQEVRLVLHLAPGTAAEDVRAAVARLQHAIAADEAFVAAASSVEIGFAPPP